MTCAAGRLTCHSFGTMRLSASISLNHGMPGKTTPGQSCGSDISALHYLLTWMFFLHSNVLGSSDAMGAIWLPPGDPGKLIMVLE
jgi:hypothetical protein